MHIILFMTNKSEMSFNILMNYMSVCMSVFKLLSTRASF